MKLLFVYDYFELFCETRIKILSHIFSESHLHSQFESENYASKFYLIII